MVAIVGGNNLGLNLGSLSSLGLRGQLGSATQGRNGERAYVNVATGNLVLQDLDARLVGLGPDTATLRTYNSLGGWDFDGNADGWQAAPTKAIQDLGNGVLRRHDLDGSTCDYAWDPGRALYVATKATGSAVDTIAKNADGTYLWTDGASGTRETYQAGTFGRITSMVDTSGNTLAFTYTNDLLTKVTSSGGETVTYTYGGATGKNLLEVKTEIVTPQATRQVLSQVQYAYDELNRLKTVTVALNPKGDAPAGALVLTSYTTTYTYDGTSARVAGITQSDGTTLGFTYVLVDGAYRVATVTDGLGKVTSFAYGTEIDAGTGLATANTTVTDPTGLATVLRYDAAGQLTQVRTGVTASNGAGLSQVAYAYDGLGNVKTITDALGRIVTFTYDAAGNLTMQVDGAGNAVERTYDARNQLVTETAYAGAGTSAPLTTRRVYDASGKSLLRFELSAEGRVTEHRYDAMGQRVATIEYRAAAYDVSALGPTTAPTEAQLATWAVAQDRSRTTRTDLAWDFRGQLQTRTAWASVDAAGNGVAGTGSVTKYVYDERGQLVQTVTPDQNGITDTVYDGFGRVVMTVTRSVNPDEIARAKPTENPASITTLTSYDDASRKTKVTLANGLVTTSTFDAAGRLASVVQSTSTAPNLGTTQYFYDAAGRLLMTQDPTGRRSFLVYDAAGRKVGEIDPTGAVTEYRYDASGQLTQAIRFATPLAPETLPQLVDASGKPKGLTLDSPIDVIVYVEVWDEWGEESWLEARVAGQAPLRPASSALDGKTWRYYDGAGRLSMEVDALGYATRTEYDGASRVLSVTRYATAVSTATLGAGGGAPPAPVTSSTDRVVTYVHDRDGLLRATIDGEGYLTQLSYDASGRLVKSTRYAGKVPGFTNAASIAAAVATARATGSLAALLPTADPNDIEAFTFYDAAGRKIAEVDGERYLTESSYDANGNLWKTVRYANRVTAAVGADVQPGTLRPASNSEDRVSESTWDALGRLWRQKNAEGTITELAYDSVGNLVRSTTALNTDEARTLVTQYDVQGRVTAELSAEGAVLLPAAPTQADVDAIWAQHAVKHTYDAAGRRKTTTDALGKRTVFFYDDAGRLRFTVNGAGEITETAYDAAGRVALTDRYSNRVANPAALVGGLLSTSGQLGSLTYYRSAGTRTAYAYTARGDLEKVTDPLGGTLTNQYTAFGEIDTATQTIDATRSTATKKLWDRRGQQTVDIADFGGVSAVTLLEHDAFGRLTQANDPNGNVRVQKFDRLGRIVQTIDPLNRSRYTTWDAFERVLTQVDALGKKTQYLYDKATRKMVVITPRGIVVSTVRTRHGQTLSVTDGSANVTEYRYDRDGRLVSQSKRLDAATLLTTGRSYDRAGNLEFTTDARGVRTRYTYDAANRVLTETEDYGGLNLVTTYGYDARGNQTSVTDPRGNSRSIAFDAKGNVTTRFRSVGDGVYDYRTYAYDKAGRVVSETDMAGVVTSHVYDGLGRRTETIVDPATPSNPAGLHVRTAWAYDRDGNVISRTDANGNVTRYAYDAANRLVYTVDGLGGVEKNEYDADGRVTATLRYATPIGLAGLNAAPTVGEIAGRVLTSASDVAEYRVYDADGNVLTVVDGTGAVTRFTYDANGNVTEKRAYANRMYMPSWDRTVLAVPISSDADVRTLTVYDALNRATYTIDGVGGVVSYAYDANGNVTERVAYFNKIPMAAATKDKVSAAVALVKDAARDVRTRTVHDAANRARFTVDGTGAVVEYVYDASGNVASRTAFATRLTDAQRAALTHETTVGELGAMVVRDPLTDATVRNEYNLANWLIWTADATGAVTRLFYNASGSVVKKVQYATRVATGAALSSVARSTADQVKVLVYDKANRLTHEVDALGGVTQRVYDGAGNVVQRIAYANRTAAPTVDSNPSTVATTMATWATGAGVSAENRVARSAYDAAGRLAYAIDAVGAVTRSHYDGAGNLVAVQAWANVLTSAQLATLGPRPTTASVAALVTANPTADRTTLRAYDAGGHLVYEVDALGYVQKSTYDGAGRLTGTTLYGEATTGLAIGASASSVAAAVAAVDVAGNDRTDAYRYDAAGNVVGTTDVRGETESYGYSGTGAKTSFKSKLTAEWKYDYDAAGRLVAETSPSLYVTSASVDAATGVVSLTKTAAPVSIRTALKYDAFGNLLERTEAVGLPGERTTKYAYDASGRQVLTTFPKVGVYAEDPASLATNGASSLAARVDAERALFVRVAYDTYGNAISNTDVAGAISYKVYDALGRVRYEVDALGYVTEHVRNAFGEDTSLVRYAEAVVGVTAPPTASQLATLLATSAKRTLVTVRDAMGRAVTVTQPAAYVNTGSVAGVYAPSTRNVYDAFGQLVRTYALVDPAGKWAGTAVHQFDRRGQETATVDAGGYVTLRDYDAAGNAWRIAERATAISATLAEADPALVYFDVTASPFTNEDDRVVEYGFDLANRRVSEKRIGVECTDASGVTARKDLVTSYAYDAVGNLTATVDALGGTTATTYDALGRIVAVTAPSRVAAIDGAGTQATFSPVTVFRRDAHGNVVERIEFATAPASFDDEAVPASGDRRTLTAYDVRGNALQTTDAEGVAHLMSYDAAGRLAKEWQGVNSASTEADPLTSTKVSTTLFTAYRYDALGRQIATITPGSTSVLGADAAGAPVLQSISHAEAGTVTTAQKFNAFGELTERRTTTTGRAPAPGDAESFEYDDAGRLWRTNSDSGQVRILLYDLLGNQTAEITSDGVADLTTSSAALADQGATLRRTTFERDLLGRVKSQKLPVRSVATSWGTTTTAQPVVWMTYDRWGNVLSQTDARNASWITTYRYNANDQLIEKWATNQDGVKGDQVWVKFGATAPTAPRTFIRYDELGRQVAIVDAKGYVNRQEWDAAGQLVRELHADGGIVSYAYDAFGDRVRTTDAEGHATTYGYDRMGRNRTVTSSTVEVWRAATAASVVKVGDQSLTTTKIYDWAGRLIQQEGADGTLTTYTLDRRGQIVATTLPMGHVLVNGEWLLKTTPGFQTLSAYDVFGRQIAERDAGNAVATWTYDAFGRLTGKRDIGAATYSFTYDQARQLRSQTSTRGQSLAFAYDAAGQLVRIDDGPLGKTTQYAYNLAGQRVWESTTQGGKAYQNQWLAYDALGRLTKVETWDGIVVEIAYDLNGNRSWQRTTYNTVTDPTARVKLYYFAYDAMNRQTLVDGAVNNDAGDIANVIAGQGHILTYDKNGNRVSDTYWGKRVVVRERWVTRREDTIPVTYYRELETTYELLDGRMTEFYRYDALNRIAGIKTGAILEGGNAALAESTSSESELDTRLYDAASRVVHVGPKTPTPYGYTGALATTPYTDTNGARQRISQYDDNGRLTSQYVRKADNTFESHTQYLREAVIGTRTVIDRSNPYEPEPREVPVYGTVSGYDAAGNVLGYKVTSPSGTTEYTRTLAKLDGYRETKIAGGGGTTTSGYDANGFLTSIDDWNLWENDRTLVNDANGVVLQKTQGGGWVKTGLFTQEFVANQLRQLVVDGNAMGTYGIGQDPVDPTNDEGKPIFTTQADFDLAYEPIVSSAAATGHYSVRPGDTLRSIAQTSYGDAELWYLIADANGLRSDADLRVGQELLVPTRAAGTHNTADVYKPYDPSKIIGDTSPYLPVPEPEDDGCAIVKLIVVVVVVVAVTIATSGALAALAPALSGFAGGMLAGAIAGAVGSLAGQGMAIAMGMQDGIDWTQVGLSALGGAVSAGVGNALSGVAKGAKEISGAWGVLARSGVAAAKAALTSAATQGIAIVTGLEDDFSWRDVAASAASAAVSSPMGEAMEGFDGSRIERVALETVTGTVSSTVAALVRGGKLDMARIAADAFGNALGNSLGQAINGEIAEWKLRRDDRNALRLRLWGGPPASGLPGQLTLGGSGFDYSGTPEEALIEEATAAPEPEAPPEQEPAPATVRAGDYGGSLERIARSQLGPNATQAEITNYVGQLFELNGNPNPRAIGPDQEIVLPDGSTRAPTSGLASYMSDIAYGESIREQVGGAEMDGQSALTDPATQPSGTSGGTDVARAQQVLNDLLDDMRRNPLKYLQQQIADDMARIRREAAPSMTAGPSGPVHEWTRAEFEAYQAAHDPMKPLNALTSANPVAVMAVMSHDLSDIEGLNSAMDLADAAWGLASGLAATTVPSAPAPAFSQPRIGSVQPPDLPPGPQFGTEIHERIGDWYRSTYPEANLVLNTRPGQNGVDIEVPPQFAREVGFRYGEIKPPTNYGEVSYDQQVPRWGLTPPQVQPIMYDYSGNFYMGFGRPYWAPPPSPVFPAPVTDPGRQR